MERLAQYASISPEFFDQVSKRGTLDFTFSEVSDGTGSSRSACGLSASAVKSGQIGEAADALPRLLSGNQEIQVVSLFWDSSTFVVAQDLLLRELIGQFKRRWEADPYSRKDVSGLSSFFKNAREFQVVDVVTQARKNVVMFDMDGTLKDLPLTQLLQLLPTHWSSGAVAMQIEEDTVYLIEVTYMEANQNFHVKYGFPLDRSEASNSNGSGGGSSQTSPHSHSQNGNGHSDSSGTEQTADPDMAGRPPSSLGQLGRILGEGLTSTVYLGALQENDSRVAIKVVEKKKLNATTAAYLIREMEVWGAVSRSGGHPNILGIADVFEVSPTRLHIVTDLMRGDLMTQIQRAVRRNGGNGNGVGYKASLVPVSWVRWVISDVASGLAYLHDLDIVHRNISAENILLTRRIDGSQEPPENLARICDFGFAHRLTSVTVLKDVVGVPSYLAPEMVFPVSGARGIGYGAPGQGLEVDLWALGVVLYFCVFGSNPFACEELSLEMVQRKLNTFEFDQERLNQMDPPSLRDMLRRLLQRDVASRLTAREALKHDFVREIARLQAETASSNEEKGIFSDFKRCLCNIMDVVCSFCMQCTSGRPENKTLLTVEQQARTVKR